MPYLNLGQKHIKFTMIDNPDSKNKDYFIEIILNLAFLKSEIKELKNLTIKDFSSDILLSERELEVLKLLSEGKNNQEIAKLMHISVHTVKVHIHNIFNKLNSTDRTEAVTKAIKANLIKI